MLDERRQVFISFGIGIISFQLAAISATWILMEPDIAFVCSLVLASSMALVWRYGRRIYSRFEIKADELIQFEDLNNKIHDV